MQIYCGSRIERERENEWDMETWIPRFTPANRHQCANCRKEIVNTNVHQLEVHAATHDAKLWPKEKCWPKEFPAA